MTAQRYGLKRKQEWMDTERIRQLKDVGMNLIMKTDKNEKRNSRGRAMDDNLWNEWLKKLKAYKGVNGHCDVPQRSSQNSKLGRWVNNQRGAWKENKKWMSSWRIKKLDDVELKW